MMSAAQFMPASEDPKDLRKSSELQALWIERQGQTTQHHWKTIQEVREECKACRADRQLVESMLHQRLDVQDLLLAEIRTNGKWVLRIISALGTIAALLVAAKAAGILK
jgi:hypothetical protein